MNWNLLSLSVARMRESMLSIAVLWLKVQKPNLKRSDKCSSLKPPLMVVREAKKLPLDKFWASYRTFHLSINMCLTRLVMNSVNLALSFYRSHFRSSPRLLKHDLFAFSVKSLAPRKTITFVKSLNQRTCLRTPDLRVVTLGVQESMSTLTMWPMKLRDLGMLYLT